MKTEREIRTQIAHVLRIKAFEMRMLPIASNVVSEMADLVDSEHSLEDLTSCDDLDYTSRQRTLIKNEVISQLEEAIQKIKDDP